MKLPLIIQVPVAAGFAAYIGFSMTAIRPMMGYSEFSMYVCWFFAIVAGVGAMAFFYWLGNQQQFKKWKSGDKLNIMGREVTFEGAFATKLQQWSDYRYFINQKARADNPHVMALYVELLIYNALVQQFKMGRRVKDETGKIIVPETLNGITPIVGIFEEDDGSKYMLVVMELGLPARNVQTNIDYQLKTLAEVDRLRYETEEAFIKQLAAAGLYPLQTVNTQALQAHDLSLLPCSVELKKISAPADKSKSPYAPGSTEKGDAQFHHYG